MKPVTSKEFQIRLTPGAVLKCPRCGGEDTLSIYDGDTVPMHETMPDAKTVAGGLALSKDGHCFYVCLNACACISCSAGSYIVDLRVVNDPEVSQEWADAHFWLNGPIGEPDIRFTAVCRGAGLRHKWTCESTKTDAGELEHYRFGPFVSRSSLEGSNGVANCAGGRVWKDAAALVARVWPLIVKDAEWFESLTVKGRWPLRKVAGWTARSGQKKGDPEAA